MRLKCSPIHRWRGQGPPANSLVGNVEIKSRQNHDEGWNPYD